MLSKIKLIIAGIGTVVMTILYALLQKEKSDRADEHAEIAEEREKVAKENVDIIIDDQKRQEKVKNEKVDPDKPRDYFS